jgi:hypothetical protein
MREIRVRIDRIGLGIGGMRGRIDRMRGRIDVHGRRAPAC